MKNKIGEELDRALHDIYGICEISGIKIDRIYLDEQRHYFLSKYWGADPDKGLTSLTYLNIAIEKR